MMVATGNFSKDEVMLCAVMNCMSSEVEVQLHDIRWVSSRGRQDVEDDMRWMLVRARQEVEGDPSWGRCAAPAVPRGRRCRRPVAVGTSAAASVWAVGGPISDWVVRGGGGVGKKKYSPCFGLGSPNKDGVTSAF